MLFIFAVGIGMVYGAPRFRGIPGHHETKNRREKRSREPGNIQTARIYVERKRHDKRSKY